MPPHINVRADVGHRKVVISFLVSVMLTVAPIQGSASPSQQSIFPNAIHLTAEDISSMLAGDPFGLGRMIAFETGISFHSTGDYGAEDWIAIRGFGRDDSRLTLVLLDGRPINQRTHTIDLDDVIVGAIESVTIYPGPLPAHFGGYQSVLDIRTRTNVDEVNLNASVGSFNSYELSGSFGRAGTTFWGGHFELGTTDGYSFTTHSYRLDVIPPFFARPPEFMPFQPVPDHTFTDAGFRYFNGVVYLGHSLSDDVRVVGRLGHLYSHKNLSSTVWEVLDYATRQPLGVFVRDIRYRQYTSLSLQATPARGSRLDYDFLAYYIYEDEELGTEGKGYYLGEQRRDRFGLRGYYRHALARTMGIRVGGEINRVVGWLRNPELLMFPWPMYENVPSQNFYGLYVQADYQPWTGAYILAGLRHDGQTESNNRTVPSLSFQQSFADGRFSLFGLYGMSSRWIPETELERAVARNESIRMERIYGTEIGARASWFDNRLLTRLNWFDLRQESDRFIGGVKQAVTGRVEAVEFSVDAHITSFLRLRSNATHFLNQENTQLPGAYDWLINFGLLFRATPNLVLEASARYLDRFVTGLEDFGFKQPAVTIVDVGLNWKITRSPGISAFFGIYNAFDEDYKTFPERPDWRLPNQMPGRHLQAVITVDFN